jgi:hypothetical protein
VSHVTTGTGLLVMMVLLLAVYLQLLPSCHPQDRPSESTLLLSGVGAWAHGGALSQLCCCAALLGMYCAPLLYLQLWPLDQPQVRPGRHQEVVAVADGGDGDGHCWLWQTRVTCKA